MSPGCESGMWGGGAWTAEIYKRMRSYAPGESSYLCCVVDVFLTLTKIRGFSGCKNPLQRQPLSLYGATLLPGWTLIFSYANILYLTS